MRNPDIKPSNTFFCEYCGKEKSNTGSHPVTVLICDDCYDLDVAALRARLVTTIAERDRLQMMVDSLIYWLGTVDFDSLRSTYEQAKLELGSRPSDVSKEV